MADAGVVAQTGGSRPTAGRIPPVAEALGYAGGALALAALITLVTMFWADLGVWGRSGICAAVAVAALVGGFALVRLEEPAAKRLSYFLLFLGVAAVGCSAGFVTQYAALQRLAGPMTVAQAQDKANEWAWFVGMLGVAISGGLVWMRHKTWLQHLGFGIGVGMSALLVLPLLPIDGPDWGAGLVLALVGVAWGALALRGWLPPENAALLLASVGVLGGIELMAVSGTSQDGALLAWAVWLGTAASIALIAAGATFKRFVVVGIGAIGLVLFGIQLLSEVLDIGAGMPIVFLVVGVALVVGATYLTRRFASAEKRSAGIVTEIAGYAGVAFIAVGASTLLGEYWDDLNTPIRIAVPAVVSAIAYTCGFIAARTQTKAAQRFSRVLAGGGAVAAGASVGMIVYPIAVDRFGSGQPSGNEMWVAWRDPASWAQFFGALGAIVFGGITWRFRPGAFTQIVTAAACFMAVVSGFNLIPPPRVQFWWPGAVILAIGVGWLLMGLFERFRPANVAIGIGCSFAIIGTMMFQNDPSGSRQEWSALLGIALSVAAIVASILAKRAVLLGFGAAGMVIFSFMTVQLYFKGDIVGPIALLVTGVVFIAMAVLVAVVLPKLRGPSKGGGLKAV